MGNQGDTFLAHRGAEADAFIEGYFSRSEKVLLVAGIGFDPRSTVLPSTFFEACKGSMSALWLREKRPDEPPDLLERAAVTTTALASLTADQASRVANIEIIAEDGAAVGGRQAVHEIAKSANNSYSDIAVDISALSRGVGFPIIRFLWQARQEGMIRANIHVLAKNHPELDHTIRPISNDRADYIHGFAGETGLDAARDAIKLWLPQLVPGRQEMLNLIYRKIVPDEVCPILPFPSQDPRLGDELLFEYRDLLEEWRVDRQNFLFADQNDPKDLYRSIVRIDNKRKEVFRALSGAVTYVTPVGSKIAAVGALLAAIEKNLPIPYVEAVGYAVTGASLQRHNWGNQETFHLWIGGGFQQENVAGGS